MDAKEQTWWSEVEGIIGNFTTESIFDLDADEFLHKCYDEGFSPLKAAMELIEATFA